MVVTARSNTCENIQSIHLTYSQDLNYGTGRQLSVIFPCKKPIPDSIQYIRVFDLCSIVHRWGRLLEAVIWGQRRCTTSVKVESTAKARTRSKVVTRGSL